MNSFVKKLSVFSFAALASLSLIGSGTAFAVQPRFNQYKGVSGIGDESNFMRIGDKDGGDTAQACTPGQKVNVWMYVHNGSADEFNGTNNDGQGVARNTRVKVTTDLASSKTHKVTGQISADNATTVTDTAYINCDGKAVALKYNGVVKFTTTDTTGNYKLWGDPFSAGGAQIGYAGGIVPGCWGYRASIVMQFEVLPEPKPEPKPYTLKCEVLNLVPVADKKDTYTIEARGTVTPADAASVKNAVINITGPNNYNVNYNGLVVNNYVFPEVAGTYNVKTTINYTVADGYDQTAPKSVTCEREVTKTVNKPPVVVVTKPGQVITTTPQPVTVVRELPRTGAGLSFALFASVVTAATFAYRKYITSRL